MINLNKITAIFIIIVSSTTFIIAISNGDHSIGITMGMISIINLLAFPK